MHFSWRPLGRRRPDERRSLQRRGQRGDQERFTEVNASTHPIVSRVTPKLSCNTIVRHVLAVSREVVCHPTEDEIK
jgi:hypothetical protein